MERTAWTDERLDERMNSIDQAMQRIDARFDRLEARMDRLEARMDGFADQLAALTRTLAQVGCFGLAGGLIAALVAVVIALA